LLSSLRYGAYHSENHETIQGNAAHDRAECCCRHSTDGYRFFEKSCHHVVVAHSDVKADPKIDEPATAFPATTLTPLPSKALILGRDFQQTKATKKVDLVPILERLPINSRPVKSNGYVEVENAPLLTQSANLQQQADNAVAAGNPEKAIQLYLKAVRINPKNEGLRSNCVALLLEQARSFDENNETDKALASYKKALSLWQGDAQTARSIKARIEFLQNN
jgi:hypothetical protein